MRILLGHAYYQQPGGEDAVFEREAELLEAHGHQVIRFTFDNDIARTMTALSMARAVFWNRDVFDRLTRVLEKTRPSVAHFHNTFPLMSPSVYSACRKASVPVLQTLHNYRLACLNGTLFRDGHICEDCLGRTVKWPGVAHRCYRADVGASTVVALASAYHARSAIYMRLVHTFIALTEESRDRFIRIGLPREKIVVKPNSVPDPGWKPRHRTKTFALYVGRLSAEKGVSTLLDAWGNHACRVPLKVVGEGRMATEIVDLARRKSNVIYAGHLQNPEVIAEMRKAAFLVVPSACYEVLPTVAIEAFSLGLPVLASDESAAGRLVEPGRNGDVFAIGNARDLASQARNLFSREDLGELQHGARRSYENVFTPERNYRVLTELYATAASS